MEAYLKSSAGDNSDSEQIEILIEARLQARTNKDWTEADRMRGELDAMGIVLEDKDGKTIWRRA